MIFITNSLKNTEMSILAMLMFGSDIHRNGDLWVLYILSESQCLMETQRIPFSNTSLKGSSIFLKCITS